MNEEHDYSLLGYYICKIEDTPEYLNNISCKLISVSECLCTHEPQIQLCHGWKPHGDNEQYRSLLGLSKEQYLKMSSEIQELFDNEKFYFDGRFQNVKDAQRFYEKYFKDSHHILVSVMTNPENLTLLDDSFLMNTLMSLSDSQYYLGCDIIGADVYSFHSFLCNSLHKKFDNIKFNSFGLIDMEYETVKNMAAQIQGMGEPVDWFPVIISTVKTD